MGTFSQRKADGIKKLDKIVSDVINVTSGTAADNFSGSISEIAKEDGYIYTYKPFVWNNGSLIPIPVK